MWAALSFMWTALSLSLLLFSTALVLPPCPIRRGMRSRFLIEMVAVLGNKFARATGLSRL